jgi:D-alanine-D-alanine ligase
MKKQRVLVVLHSSLVPPDTLEGRTEKEIAEWRTEYDVISTLKARGHEVLCVGVLDSLTELRTSIADWKPDLVFNLLEEFDGIGTYDQHVVAFLELLRQPYTGCNPRGLLLSRDKPLCKQLLSYHRIPTPQFAVFNRGARVNVPRRLRFPLFVKSRSKMRRSALRRPRWSRMPRSSRSASSSSTTRSAPMHWSRSTSRAANCTSG